MKTRLFAFLLMLALFVNLFAACSNDGVQDATTADPEKSTGTVSDASEESVYSIGFGKVDVTPTESVPLGGYMGKDSAEFRWSTTTEWPFSAICVAITDDQDNTVILITLDFLNSAMGNALRDAISEIHGIPYENIMVHATHNHSGPATSYSHGVITNYITQVTNGVLVAVNTALDDRKPITGMQTTFARPEGVNSERHYLLADGSYQSYGVGSVPKDQLIGHYGVADNLLQVARFTRDGGKNIVFVNWQGHPPGTNPNTIATSNYPGVLRNYLDTNLNCESIFFLGGSGNLNNSSQIAGEIIHDDYQGLGENLGAAAVAAAANFKDRSLSAIQVNEKMLQLKNLNYGANKIWVYAITIGDFALVTAPFEIFDDNAVAVRENVPYVMTMYITCCNGSNGYLPTPPSFGWKITYEATTTKFPEGTAEILQDELIGMLKENAAASGYEGPEKDADYYQAEFVPKSDGVTYLNMAPGDTTKYSAVENDFFAFQLFGNNKLKNFLCKDEALVQEILSKNEVMLILDVQNVVVGIEEAK